MVHPLNSQKVPFAFPQNAEPLLRRARKVLHLQPPLKESYGEALTGKRGAIASALLSPKRSVLILGGSGGGRSSPDAVAPSITGEVVIRDFMVSLQMPKFTLPQSSELNGSPSKNGDDEGSSPLRHGRQTSFGASTPQRSFNGEKRESFFVLAMEFDVPLSGMPPNSPYMVGSLMRDVNFTINMKLTSSHLLL